MLSELEDKLDTAELYGRRATDRGLTLGDWLDKILIGAIAIIFSGVGFMINRFGDKVEKLTEKVEHLTETLVVITTKQSNNEQNITELKAVVTKHLDQDREMYRKLPK